MYGIFVVGRNESNKKTNNKQQIFMSPYENIISKRKFCMEFFRSLSILAHSLWAKSEKLRGG